MTMGAVQDSLVRSHYRFLFRLKKKKSKQTICFSPKGSNKKTHTLVEVN